MRRLYLRIYLTIVMVLLVFGVLLATTWWLFSDRDEASKRGLATLLRHALPGADAPPEQLRRVLEELGADFRADITVRDANGNLIAAAGPPRALPKHRKSGWHRGGPRGHRLTIRLSDGRWLIAGRTHAPRFFIPPWLLVILLLAIAVAVGAYPMTRRITRRLERLRGQVERLGAGDLAARVAVQGHDEVADLARSFNRAAAHIEQLVEAQRATLASASHELRSPLTRIRMAIELLGETRRPELIERVARDIEELDDLIDELLLASRLQALAGDAGSERVDVLVILAEEGARVDAEVDGEPVEIMVNPRLVRRLIRNLLENAARYGAGSAIQAHVGRLPDGAVEILVNDRGPGVPEAERERIFDPFYRPAGMQETGEGGVGLGLSLVRQIAESHHGSALYRARPGGGSQFVVTLYAVNADH